MSKFILVEKSARRPSNAYGAYVRMAVLEIEEGFEGEPTMISERAKGVVRIVEEWGPCYVGLTERSQANRARAAANELLRRLNCPLERMVMEVA